MAADGPSERHSDRTMKIIAWVFLLIGTFLIGVGQRISEQAYGEWSDLLIDQMFSKSK